MMFDAEYLRDLGVVRATHPHSDRLHPTLCCQAECGKILVKDGTDILRRVKFPKSIPFRQRVTIKSQTAGWHFQSDVKWNLTLTYLMHNACQFCADLEHLVHCYKHHRVWYLVFSGEWALRRIASHLTERPYDLISGAPWDGIGAAASDAMEMLQLVVM